MSDEAIAIAYAHLVAGGADPADLVLFVISSQAPNADRFRVAYPHERPDDRWTIGGLPWAQARALLPDEWLERADRLRAERGTSEVLAVCIDPQGYVYVELQPRPPLALGSA